MIIENVSEIRTQKARSIAALPNHVTRTLQYKVLQLPLEHSDICVIESFIKRLDGNGQRTFARPCPTKPRHGFVDSRIVSSMADVLGLSAEVMRADALGEIVLMPYISADRSAVLTPTAVAIGAGNDGATQGRDALTLPVAFVSISSGLIADSRIENCAYIEAISYMGVVYAVQARDGVAIANGAGDYIPCRMRVTAIETTEGTAEEFENRISNSQEGTILYHPNGTILSHYSQHACLKNMPIIFSEKCPSIGDTLTPTVTVEQPKTADMLKGIERGMEKDLVQSQSDECSMAVSMVHNASALIQDSNGAYALGYAVAVLLRLAYAACIGEYRHKRKSHRVSRDVIYRRALYSFDGFLKSRIKMKPALESFFHSKWATGYGGERWATCATVAIALETALVSFVKTGKSESAKGVVAAAHNVINCAHNNGKFLSKFTSNRTFDNAANGEMMQTLQAYFAAYSVIVSRGNTPLTVIGKLRGFRIRHKKAPRTIGQKYLQFAFRQDNAVFHFQFKSDGIEGYKSADIQRYVMPDYVARYLDLLSHDLPKARSFASGKRYWEIPADILSPTSQLVSVLSNAGIEVN